ncbi:ATP-binding protein [Rubinisphaera margarita]|uniref:ATP-binding protein n=1 Tax=Rubinisphaera margarita TaxID=2909586 RepID=UPI001EE80F46|nr:ATP-binding protein [Rubinisphaera margarita]MCG6158074.1 ATP-binding protein [Rubinisphaera margarita]
MQQPKSSQSSSSGCPTTTRVVIPSDDACALDLQDQIIEQMEQQSFSSRDLFSTRLALSELLTNAIRHGNRMDYDKSVTVEWNLSATRIDVTITDEGEGFDPSHLPDPTDEENLERCGGRGVLLVRSFLDEVCYNERGNSVHIVKHASSGDDA